MVLVLERLVLKLSFCAALALRFDANIAVASIPVGEDALDKMCGLGCRLGRLVVDPFT